MTSLHVVNSLCNNIWWMERFLLSACHYFSPPKLSVHIHQPKALSR